MDLQLSGKRALVTGSTGAIGEAIARALAAESATVIIHGRNPAAAHALADRLSAQP
jgi:3-oxoacyl-[acyl-carrier protein] reductase